MQTPTEPLRILSLTAENIKKLKAITITPTGSTVVLSGKNGQGKTSALDSIWWGLGGKDAVQERPIREGEDRAVIRITLGTKSGEAVLLVERTFKRMRDPETNLETEQTTKLEVSSPDGAKFNTPQAMLDALCGDMTFDPLSFARADDKTRFDILKNFVQGFDFAAYELAQKADFDKRTLLNRKALESKSLASTINVPSSAPDELVDESALVAELADVGKKAKEREEAVVARKNAITDVELMLQSLRDDLDINDTHIMKLAADIKKMQAELEERTANSTSIIHQIAEVKTKVEEAKAVPEPAPILVDDIKKKVDEARTANAAWELKARKTRAMDEAAEYVKQAEALTLTMNERKEERNKVIRGAKLPMEGFSITEDNEVFFKGVPFSQASDAEQLRASVAVGMALNPKVQVLRVRDGSLLDEDGMKELSAMAELNGYQVWVERVDSSGKVGVVLENGEVKA